MREDKSRLIKFARQFGLIFGLYWCLNLIFMTLSSKLVFFNFISIVLFFLTPFLAYRLTVGYRKIALNDKIGIFHAWQFGIMLYFFASLIISIPCYFLFRYLVSIDYFTTLMQDLYKIADNLKMDKSMLDPTAQLLNSPVKMTFQIIFSSIFWGMILSVPTAIFAKRKNEIR